MATPYKQLSEPARDLFDSFHRIDSDSYGNPRYYVPGFCLSAEDKAHRSRFGLTVYRGKRFGPGYVVQTYSLESLCEQIIAGRKP